MRDANPFRFWLPIREPTDTTGRAGASRGLRKAEIMKPTLLYRIALGVARCYCCEPYLWLPDFQNIVPGSSRRPAGHERCPLSDDGRQLQLWRLVYRVRSIVYSLSAFLGIPGLASGWPGSKESSNKRGLGVELFRGLCSESSLELEVFFPGSRGGFSSGGPLPRLGRRAGQGNKGPGLAETGKFCRFWNAITLIDQVVSVNRLITIVTAEVASFKLVAVDKVAIEVGRSVKKGNSY